MRDVMRLLFSGPMYFHTTVNTFDTMSLLGIATFTSDLWIAALKATLSIANEAGDEAYANKLSEVFNIALSNFIKYLWNGEYFDLWFDPVSGLRDNAVMTAGLTGEWYLRVLLGLDYAVDKDKVVSMLRAIYRNNFKKGEGLINASYPGKPRPSLVGDLKYFNSTGIPYSVGGQMDTPWTGIEIPVAIHMIWEGLVNEGLEILRSVHDRYIDYGLYWNHVECDGHYFRPLVSLDIPNALAGFRYIGRDKSITVNPRIKTPIRGPVLAPGSVMTLDYGEHEVKLTGRIGEVEVSKITLSGFMGKSIRVFYNGVEVKAVVNIEDGHVSVILDNPVKLSRGGTLTIIGY
ncbi:GH116 family glycosyl hydrolase [Caldivirga maquilingensis]|uniref:GH116 family glycosyl hydrolase n=1 Tax=Caldivirga maquilingensis TaxID=76887 RepID=UPI0000F24A7E|nr:GH116 family glycosyl hydrolase [Caldivirga maquilingensis]